MKWYDNLETPIGWLEIYASENAVNRVEFCEVPIKRPNTNSVTDLAKMELNAYFQGELTRFTVPYQQAGTEFQQRVWHALTTVPYGTTAAYSEIAEKIVNPKAVRAVGGANNRNKIAIIVPCHRVIGKNGQLVGYFGGVERKKYLLALEQKSEQQDGSK
ncbi:MAG: methylated-DNA--[protein]-cysteine S-methyltransferase [Culicoidibacterales bacterium]